MYIALIIADAQGLPPFRPTFVINGISVFDNSSFDSTADTNPTGIPITSAGFTTDDPTALAIALG